MKENLYLKRINRTFFMKDPVKAAPKLLGKYLVRKISTHIIISKIVEVEAYGDKEDKACHIGRFGRTKRSAPLFGEVGKAYIYSVHINTYCLNIVSHTKSKGGGILIRALEPIKGVNWILKNLNITDKKYDERKLLNGPGKLCRALKLDKSLNEEDLIKGSRLYITEGEKVSKKMIEQTPRINIPYAEESKDWLWRFIIKDSPFLSRGI